MVEKILIDAVMYRVIQTQELLIVDGRECGAEVDYNSATIKISKEKVGDGSKAKFLMHEIVHAILHERGLFEESENEELVDELAKGFVNLIRQNSELVNFISEGLKNDEHREIYFEGRRRERDRHGNFETF